jgi:hypothetical protein
MISDRLKLDAQGFIVCLHKRRQARIAQNGLYAWCNLCKCEHNLAELCNFPAEDNYPAEDNFSMPNISIG